MNIIQFLCTEHFYVYPIVLSITILYLKSTNDHCVNKIEYIILCLGVYVWYKCLPSVLTHCDVEHCDVYVYLYITMSNND